MYWHNMNIANSVVLNMGVSDFMDSVKYNKTLLGKVLKNKKDFAEARRLYQETCLDRKGNQEE